MSNNLSWSSLKFLFDNYVEMKRYIEMGSVPEYFANYWKLLCLTNVNWNQAHGLDVVINVSTHFSNYYVFSRDDRTKLHALTWDMYNHSEIDIDHIHSQWVAHSENISKHLKSSERRCIGVMSGKNMLTYDGQALMPALVLKSGDTVKEVNEYVRKAMYLLEALKK